MVVTVVMILFLFWCLYSMLPGRFDLRILFALAEPAIFLYASLLFPSLLGATTLYLPALDFSP